MFIIFTGDFQHCAPEGRCAALVAGCPRLPVSNSRLQIKHDPVTSRPLTIREPSDMVQWEADERTLLAAVAKASNKTGYFGVYHSNPGGLTAGRATTSIDASW